jgi:lysophospholipase L1-like esterase
MNKGKRVLFALAPLTLGVLAWELGARVLGVSECEPPRPETGTWAEMQADSRYLWRLTPGYRITSPDGSATTISPLGLRDDFQPRAKAPNERRILTTGDSSVYGWGVPTGRTYQEELERRLNQSFPQWRFEVINLGVPGYSSEQSLRLLEDVGWSLEPDLLLVSNIFSDCNIDAFQDARALALVNADESPAHRALEGSRTYCAAWNTYASWYSNRNQERNRVLMPGVPRDTRWLEKVDLFLDLSRVPLTDYLANLRRMHAEAKARGARVVLAPLAQEWDVGRWSVPHLPRPTEGQVLPWHPYREAMAELAEELEVGLVSFPDAFSTTNRPKEQLFSDPVHPSPQGAALMAETMHTWLLAHPEVLGLRGS